MGCATTSRRFEREMLFTPRSTLRETFTVAPLDVKKDRTPHTSAKRRPAAQVDLHKHRSCRGCGCSQHSGQTAPQHTPLHAPHAPPSAPRPATRRAKAPCTCTMDCRRSGTDGPTDSDPARAGCQRVAVGGACGRCGGRRRERSRGWSEARAAAAAPPPPATIVRGSPLPPGAGSAVRLAAAQRRRASSHASRR